MIINYAFQQMSIEISTLQQSEDVVARLRIDHELKPMSDCLRTKTSNWEKSTCKVFSYRETFLAEIFFNWFIHLIFLWVVDNWPIWIKLRGMFTFTFGPLYVILFISGFCIHKHISSYHYQHANNLRHIGRKPMVGCFNFQNITQDSPKNWDFFLQSCKLIKHYKCDICSRAVTPALINSW